MYSRNFSRIRSPWRRIRLAAVDDADVAKRPGGLETLIAQQVRSLRHAAGMSAADLAIRTGLSKAMISKVESASTSCSLTTLSRLAEGLSVPVTALFRGADSDRDASFTQAGAGSVSIRTGSQHGHEYRMLGALKDVPDALEPTLVTLTDASDTFPLFQHRGTEFLYMLSGRMTYGHGAFEYEMSPGDSLLLDGEAPHGPVALIEVPITFLAVRTR